jgi:two-component system sensor histidine kinase/response regulator
MTALVKWIESIFASIPLQFLEVWGRFGFLLGIALMLFAYGGFTFRAGGRWRLGRERQSWDSQAMLGLVVTSVLVIATGALGSFIVLVPGAQTFESLKDLSVFLCILLFGYPALLIMPVVYAMSDVIEGVPPGFIQDWFFGYFINPACFWIAYQFIGKDPDFRQARTWRWYALFVVVFMALEPAMWGYICADKFTSEISYRNITPALFFTTLVTWCLAPFAMLVALPLARKGGLYWADIPGHVRERLIGSKDWIWESGRSHATADDNSAAQGIPVHVVIVGAFVALTLSAVGTTAYFSLRSAENDATKLASRLHQEIADNINFQLDDYLEASDRFPESERIVGTNRLLQGLAIARHGRVAIIDRAGQFIASADAAHALDLVEQTAIQTLAKSPGGLGALQGALQFHFDVVTVKPLARETWLAQASPYADKRSRHSDWLLLTAMPQAYYLRGIRGGNSQSAMVSAIALTLALVLASWLAFMVTTPIRRVARVARALAQGDSAQRVPPSHILEIDALSQSFNHMADQLTQYTERLQIATRVAKLGIWDWDVVRDVLLWDDAMYQIFGVRREDFGGAFEAWSQLLDPDDKARAQAEVEASVRNGTELHSEFNILWPDGTRRTIKVEGRTIRDASGLPLRMVGVNYDITDRTLAEQELRTHRDSLEKLVDERTQALQRVNSELRLAMTQLVQTEKIASLGRLVAGMAHELNTPLGNALTVASALKFGTQDFSDKVNGLGIKRSELYAFREMCEEAATIIERNAHRAAELIGNFKAIAVDQTSGRRRSFSVRNLLDEIISTQRNPWSHSTHRIEVEVDRAIELDSYPGALGQVVANLLQNSMVHGFDGRQDGRVNIVAHSDGRNLLLAYSDNGKGIDPAYINKLFDPFFTTRLGQGGSGLGLYIVYTLVTGVLGGGISVTQSPSEGLHFDITLPLVAPDAPMQGK